MVRVLVTGAGGLIGSWLVDFLAVGGHEIVAVDNLEGGKANYVNPKARLYTLDLRHADAIKELVYHTKPQVIFHMAAFAAEGASIFNPIYTVESNLIGFLNLFTSALDVGFKTFIFTSSMAVYGDQHLNLGRTSYLFGSRKVLSGFDENNLRQPVDPYGITKADIERYLEIYSKEFGFNYVIIRPHNVYGPRQSLTNPYRNVLGIWMNRIMNGKAPIIYGDGEQTRAFTYVEDCVLYIAESAFMKQVYGEIFNMGSDEVHTVNEACRIVMDAMGYEGKPIYAPERPLEVKHAWCLQEKAKRILGYETKTSLKEGVGKMATWAKKVGPQPFSYWTQPFEIQKKIPKVWKEKQL